MSLQRLLTISAATLFVFAVAARFASVVQLSFKMRLTEAITSGEQGTDRPDSTF